MDPTKKRVAIVGAGPSGLAACKHLLAKGFLPVVFESAGGVGGVWRRTLATTRLQTPASAYRFSDFPWPADNAAADGMFPRHDQVLEYLAAYARRFGVMERVRFGCKVLAASYVGDATEPEMESWERWSGNGEAFGDGTGEWHLTVRHGGEPASTQTHRFDFLILCIGRYGAPKLPTFPHGRGPEVFRGRVLHSMEYAAMAHEDAAELVRGKRVAVVGAGKSAMDIVAQCAEANGSKYPCTMVYRSAHWMVDPKVARRVNFFTFTSARWTELMVHKPGEGFMLSLLATILTPVRWAMSKVTEAYYKRSIPMSEHGMVPDCGFDQASLGWRLGILPEGFYSMVDEGSIELRRCASVAGFSADGLGLDNADGSGEPAVAGADVVILSTGFDIDRPLRNMFTSPWFAEIISSDGDAVLPLYRHILHPRIPQLAVVGYAESGSSIYPYEMMAKWVAHLLAGAVRLPPAGVRDMERGAAEWARWGAAARRRCGGHFLKSCVASVTTWYHDQLCRDMGYSPRRKDGWLAELLEPYGPTDYAGIQ
ncbi:unnamed protein product [Urochloa decumbens]|uniref:Flavin-containing monooxygenase n=1 Tax=Urochloa decumbens TaxID=240449 RepID=A0ABC9DGK9_9POAL